MKWLHVSTEFMTSRRSETYVDWEGMVDPKRVLRISKRRYDKWRGEYQEHNEVVWLLFLHWMHAIMDTWGTPSEQGSFYVLEALTMVFGGDSQIAFMSEKNE